MTSSNISESPADLVRRIIDLIENSTHTAELWNYLGCSLEAGQMATVNNSKYSSKECFVTALSCEAENSDALMNLGVSLVGDEEVTINGEQYTKMQCCIKALENGYVESWVLWNSLGFSIQADSVASVNGIDYSIKDCFVKALEYNPSEGSLWENLSFVVGKDEEVTINSKQYTKMNICVKALECSEDRWVLWNSLGFSIQADSVASVNGIEYSIKDCFVKALEYNPSNGNIWANLGALLCDDEEVTINGEQYTKMNICIKALENDSEDYNNDRTENSTHTAELWNYLGCSLGAGQVATVNNSKYSSKECFVKALSCDSRCGEAWAYLGDVMCEEEEVFVGGVLYTKIQCVSNAKELIAPINDYDNAQSHT
eukprot:Tbor_TRINITY_DN5097_c3_g2::TRINITY_DN5097_c3_g2_i3::g.14013::m.14013